MVQNSFESDVRKHSKVSSPSVNGVRDQDFIFLAFYKFDCMTSSAEKQFLPI